VAVPRSEGSVTGHNPWVVLPLSGELDVANANAAHKLMLGLELRPGGQLVLDLSGLTFMDSTGVRLILQAREHARMSGASLVVVRPRAGAMRVLELVGLDDQLEFVESA
jgi:anti-sigma B factor antagonist